MLLRAIAVRRTLHADPSKALSAPPLGGGRSAPPWTQTPSALIDWWGRRMSTSGESEGRPEVELCSVGGGRWLLRPRHAVVSVEHRGCVNHRGCLWRKYAASGHSGPRKRNSGQSGGGGGGPPPFHVVVNQEIKATQSVEVLLGLVVVHGARFNFMNVSTAVSMLAKLASMRATRVGRTPVGKMLREDAGFIVLCAYSYFATRKTMPSWGEVWTAVRALFGQRLEAKLIDLVRLHCGAFDGQAIGNVLNGLAVLHADLGVTSVDDGLAEQLAEVVERVADNMNAQDIATTLNALSKVEAVAGAMSPARWAAMARAAERTAPTMNTQGVANTLNALAKVKAVAGAMSPAGWAAIAKAAERTAPTMNARDFAKALNALGSTHNQGLRTSN